MNVIYFLLYGVPITVIVVTLWVGFLGWKFYVQEVLKADDTPPPALEHQETP